MNFSFINEEKIINFFNPNNLVRLKNTVNKTLEVLRPNLFIGMLEKYKEIEKANYSHNILLFENGPIFWKENPFEKVFTIIMGGNKFEKNPYINLKSFENKNFFDFFDAKYLLLDILKLCNISSEDELYFFRMDEFYDNNNFEKYNDFLNILNKKKLISKDNLDINYKFFHPGKTALIFIENPKIKNDFIFLGYCGELNPFILNEFDIISQNEYGGISAILLFQDSLDILYKNKDLLKKEIFISEFQSVYRDFSLVFNEDAKISDLKNNFFKTIEAEKKLKNIIHNFEIFDIFQNDEMKKFGKKSIGFSFKICSDKKTLNDKEIKEIVDIIILNIKLEFNAFFTFEL
jgi:phenylalanyl-tRNA synthetase beta subunit